MLKKILLTSLIVLPLLLVARSIYQKWQFESMGYSQPQRETVQTLSIIQKEKIKVGMLYLPNSKVGYNYLSRFCNWDQILIFDTTGKLVEYNASNLGGRCYQDIITDLCNNSFVPNEINNPEGMISLDSILTYTIQIDSTKSVKSAKYTLVFGWANYVAYSIKKETVSFLKCIENDPDFKIMSINMDYSNSWYPVDVNIPEHVFK